MCFSTSCANEESEPSIESEEIEEPEEDVVVAPVPPLIAHRGCWSGDSLPQNSVAAFKKTLQQDIYGSEFDVYETSDGQIVVNHDVTYGGMEITKNPYEGLGKHHLSNGEPLPLFEDFLRVYIETDTHVMINSYLADSVLVTTDMVMTVIQEQKKE